MTCAILLFYCALYFICLYCVDNSCVMCGEYFCSGTFFAKHNFCSIVLFGEG